MTGQTFTVCSGLGNFQTVVDDVGTKAAHIMNIRAFGLTIRRLFPGTVNSDQFSEPQPLIMMIPGVLTATNLVTILVVRTFLLPGGCDD